jgi:opacity protein-like surface antigen
VIGFEEDFGYARDFFGQRPDGNSSVLVLMSNGLLELPIVPIIHPYGLAGVGLIRAHIDTSAFSLLTGSDNSVGYNLGGGLIARLAPHIAARGDWRYFRSFKDMDVAILPSGSSLKFWRGTFGAVLSF